MKSDEQHETMIFTAFNILSQHEMYCVVLFIEYQNIAVFDTSCVSECLCAFKGGSRSKKKVRGEEISTVFNLVYFLHIYLINFVLLANFLL